MIDNKILELPDYIKIDVDGIEHLILKGGEKYLKNKKIKSIAIEINENFKDQFINVHSILDKSNFKIKQKKSINVSNSDKTERFSNQYNCIFDKIS